MVAYFSGRRARMWAPMAPNRRRPTEKPFVAMDDLEFVRTWDRVAESLEQDLLAEARGGRSNLLVAVAVLTLPSGRRGIALAADDAGDGEGMAPVSHLVARAKKRLKPQESIALEVVDVALSESASWGTQSRSASPEAREGFDDIYDDAWVELRLTRARGLVLEVAVSIAIVTLAGGQARIIFTDRESGDGQGRIEVAGLLRRVTRMKMLLPGEKIHRVLLTVSLSETVWVASSRPDPLRR